MCLEFRTHSKQEWVTLILKKYWSLLSETKTNRILAKIFAGVSKKNPSMVTRFLGNNVRIIAKNHLPVNLNTGLRKKKIKVYSKASCITV